MMIVGVVGDVGDCGRHVVGASVDGRRRTDEQIRRARTRWRVV